MSTEDLRIRNTPQISVAGLKLPHREAVQTLLTLCQLSFKNLKNIYCVQRKSRLVLN
ncbi:hypothetical protein CIB84_009461 [Bambusicola thoracicus]|uniref:Uncharacterized protein n=1 Tax=Bambusicola thoracicus TaxID=9083 RepID=A0A2P4SRR4_BAMTH|nr:hypothetical protein CIB84_009461 [Bambusicola thoracicus]